MRHISARIIGTIVLLGCVIYGWWLVALVLALACSMIFPLYIEVIVIGIIYDALFGADIDTGFSMYVGLIISVIILTLSLILRKIVRR